MSLWEIVYHTIGSDGSQDKIFEEFEGSVAETQLHVDQQVQIKYGVVDLSKETPIGDPQFGPQWYVNRKYENLVYSRGYDLSDPHKFLSVYFSQMIPIQE